MSKSPTLPPIAVVPPARKSFISRLTAGFASRLKFAAIARRLAAAPRPQSFVIPKPPPGALPRNMKPELKLAMDNAFAGMTEIANWAGQTAYSVALQEGYTFLGYAYLAELAQVPEFRRAVEIIAEEMTREWVRFQVVGDEDGTNGKKSEEIKALKRAFTTFNVQAVFHTITQQDGFFGRAHLYIDTGDTDDQDELMTSLGNGSDETTVTKMKKGALKGLRPIEAIWCYPAFYDSNNPLLPSWYNPQSWFAQGTQIHVSRLLPFVGRPVPDILKPTYSFGGLSLTQMMKPTVDNWLQTRNAVGQLIQNFSVMLLKTNMQASMGDGGTQMIERADLFNVARNNLNLMMLDKDSEDFGNVSAPLGSLDRLQAQSQEHNCSVIAIPVVKYTGISPTGLNASSDGEIRTFYDTIHARQESFFRPNLTVVFHIIQLHLWGKIDPEITFEFEPLWSLDEKSMAEVQKIQADIDCEYIDRGVLSPMDVRKQLADRPDSRYSGIKAEEMPDPLEQGPEPGNVRERIEEGGTGKIDGPGAVKTEARLSPP